MEEEEPAPVDDSTITWGVVILLAACVVVADEVLSRDVTFEQGCLAVALPAACAARIRNAEAPPWAAPALQACALLAIAGFTVQRGMGIPIVDVKGVEGFAPFIAVASTCGLAASTLNLPQPPLSSKIPYWQIVVVGCGLATQSPDFREFAGIERGASQDIANALGLTLGRVGGWSLAWATLASIVTPIALFWWSRIYMKGDHGPVQQVLAPILTPDSKQPVAFFIQLTILAIVNAVCEEVEFRMCLQGALLAGPAAGDYQWVGAAVTLQASLFAVLHYRVGLPSGRSGFFMVWLWALFLGFLRWWSGGLALVLMLHVQADVVIFLLVMIEENERIKNLEEEKKSPLRKFLGL